MLLFKLILYGNKWIISFSKLLYNSFTSRKYHNLSISSTVKPVKQKIMSENRPYLSDGFTATDRFVSRSCRRTASMMSSVISSFSGTPVCSHIFGYMLMAVNPGSVFISFNTSLPLSESKKSTRAMPSQPIAWKALTAYSRIESDKAALYVRELVGLPQWN